MNGDELIRPPRLRAGARVALVAPAGPVSAGRIAEAQTQCGRLELEPVIGSAAAHRYADYLAGSDEERLRDLQHALTAPGIEAVWALRGGYGTMRLLTGLDLSSMRVRPRAYIGFSDNTAVHLALHARGVVSFHGPHAGGDTTAVSDAAFRRVLFDARPAGVLEAPAGRPAITLHGGQSEGRLVGGNLALLAALCGTPFAPVARGAILFVEDVGEAPYRLDRAWMQLLLAGALDGVAGLAFGRFTDCGPELPALLARLAAPLGVPTVAELPIGHEPDNWTLPLGVRARLDADAGTLELLEPAVSE